MTANLVKKFKEKQLLQQLKSQDKEAFGKLLTPNSIRVKVKIAVLRP